MHEMARVINVDQPTGADRRLYGMMQHLMATYARQQAPEKPDSRGVVELQDALDAVIQLAAVITEETQAGQIQVDRGHHAAAMLMLVREYIQPLPQGMDADGVTDNLTTDLGAMVMALREARRATGAQGLAARRTGEGRARGARAYPNGWQAVTPNPGFARARWWSKYWDCVCHR
jgi:hypothetical protein